MPCFVGFGLYLSASLARGNVGDTGFAAGLVGGGSYVFVISTEMGSIKQTVSAVLFASFKGIAWILNAISWPEPIKPIWDAIGREVRRGSFKMSCS